MLKKSDPLNVRAAAALEAIRTALAQAEKSSARIREQIAAGEALIDELETATIAVLDRIAGHALDTEPAARNAAKADRAVIGELLTDAEQLVAAAHGLLADAERAENDAAATALEAKAKAAFKAQADLLAEAGPLAERLAAIGDAYMAAAQTLIRANNDLRVLGHHSRLVRPYAPTGGNQLLPPFAFIAQLRSGRLVEMSKQAKD